MVNEGVILVMLALIEPFAPEEARAWRVVNDGVMGGLSQSRFEVDQGVAVFEGQLSLANNGGFASVRRQPQPLDLNDIAGFRLKVRGDGRLYQFRVRTDAGLDGVAYRAEFETQSDQWIWVEIPINQFQPVFRGRIVEGAPALRAEDIQQLGFLIADRREGPFRLQIAAIQTY